MVIKLSKEKTKNLENSILKREATDFVCTEIHNIHTIYETCVRRNIKSNSYNQRKWDKEKHFTMKKSSPNGSPDEIYQVCKK